MSWRASPSRPAPPVTSTSPDSLFVSSSSSSRVARPGLRVGGGASGSFSASSASSSSTSAISLLTRQKAEFDDDRASVRSGRNVSGSSSTWGRSRSASTATNSSVCTAASSKTLVKGHRTPSRGNSAESRLSTKAQGKQKQQESTDSNKGPESVSNGNAELTRPKGLHPNSHIDKRPKLVETASSAANSTNSATSVASSSSVSQVARKSSWLWRSNDPQKVGPSEMVDESSVNPTSTTATLSERPSISIVSSNSRIDTSSQASILSSSAGSTTPPQVFHTPDPSPTKPTRRQPSDDTNMPPPPFPKRGWFGSVKVAPAPESAASTPPVAPQKRSEEPRPESALEEVDDAEVKSRSSKLPLPVGAPPPQAGASRGSSWFGWGGAEPEPAEPSGWNTQSEDLQVEPDYSTDESEKEEGTLKKEATRSAETLRTPRTSAENKSWLRTIWGEPPPGNTTGRTSTEEHDAPTMGVDPPLSSSASTSSAALTVEESLPRPITVPAPAATKPSSWFGRRHGDVAGQTPSTAASSLNLPPALAAVARPVGGLVSSAASIRSRTSTTDRTAPSSPHLVAPDNAPVKPLTGSIRGGASPRVGPYDTDAPFDNLVLPTFRDTFERLPRSRKVEKGKLTKAVSAVSAYFFHQPPPMEMSAHGPGDKPVRDDPAAKFPKSLEIMEEPSRLDRVRRVVTIGVHGWFPNPRLRSVFGEPTGTSVKFATMMHDAVHSYLVDHDMTSFNIQAIGLEGQGEVEARVEKHLQQIIDRAEWVEALKKADAVFLATHSQGTVVSTQLLAKLLERNIIVGHKTHMLAMCGISQGPFVYLSQSFVLTPYFNYLESAPARELFEFQSPDSAQTIKFLDSLRITLAHGIKITATGSINDQVVPLYSALFSGITHPGILRAVYIDSQAFRTSDFLANLVVFAARLRNAGLHDHDLIYHVSEALAGALMGVGHSKIYEEEEVFALAIRYHFETTTLHEPPTCLEPPTTQHLDSIPPLSMSFNPRDRRNPYLLTWALRGIIEDPKVRDLFGNELQALRDAFESWRPVSKALKEVRLKLEPIRMLPKVNTQQGKL
ncbi:BQ5605_C012g06979 [Microbotryum silenes-dioicae]|uniref:BQ5605_C012g06979 protein n=1 Tax=Microbotryum silenes-dioicae TaxID=796604 RepID=A0A2X0MM34_9BASI|nr:BQ5605_C012g06979 [Microbotryum silenes-dioicae]